MLLKVESAQPEKQLFIEMTSSITTGNVLPMVEEPRYADFARRLKEAMACKQLTVTDVKSELKITYEMARRYTLGIAMPRDERMRKLADFVGKTAAYLQFGDEAPEKFMGAAEVVDPAALTSPAPVQGVGAQPNPPHERDYALIPQYHVSGECGSGYLNGHEEVKGGLAFKRDWLARMSLKPDRLSVIYACGLSMAPTINEGEVLLVDHDQSEPRDGQVFAFERDGELLIKRLVRHPAGSWICRSDNPDKIRYADWEPVSTEQLGLLRIVGRIVWRGGAM